MAFNKIQPEQIQLATFFSDSGDIDITQSTTGVQLNLSRGITGDFSFTGTAARPFKINNRQALLLTEASSASYTFESGSFAINGSSNSNISGVNNIALNAKAVTVSGAATNNTSINGSSQLFGTGVADCFAVGRQATFTDPTTGSAIFSDFEASSSETKGNATFLVDFASGSYFEGGATYHLNNVNVRAASSGVFSGKLNVIGDTLLSGTNISGVTTFNTGFTLPQWVGHGMAGTSGTLAVSGSTLIYYGYTGGWVGVGTQAI